MIKPVCWLTRLVVKVKVFSAFFFVFVFCLVNYPPLAWFSVITKSGNTVYAYGGALDYM